MAQGLQKQLIGMAVQGGLDTKTSSPNVIPTDFLELQNVVYTETGRFKKRFGYEGKSRAILGGGTTESARAITTFNDQLLQYTDDSLLTWSDSRNSWVNKGAIRYANATSEPVSSPGYVTRNPSFAVYNDTMVVAYEVEQNPSTIYIEYKVVDNNTGALIHTGQISDGKTRALVQNIQGRFFIFYDTTTNIKFRYIDQISLTSISSAITVAGNVADYDAVTIGTRLFYTYTDVTGAGLGYVDANATVQPPVAVTSASTYSLISLSKENVNNIRLVMCNTSGDNDTVLYPYSLVYQVHPLVSFTSDSVESIAGVADPNSLTASYIYYSDLTASPGALKKVRVDETGTVSGETVLKYKMALQSKPVNLGTKTYLLATVNETYKAFQGQTSFMLDELGVIMGKFGFEVSVRQSSSSPVLRTGTVLNEQVLFMGAELAEVQRPSSGVFVPTSVKRYVADFSQLSNYFDTKLGENLHFTGGILRMYDGAQVVEHGFLETPETPTLDSTAAIGAITPAGVYTFVYVFAWRDEAGQVHRSAPSASFQWTAPGGVDPRLRVYSTPLTEKSNVEIEIYATEPNGALLYKVTSSVIGNRVINDPSIPYEVYRVQIDTAELIQNEPLYTTDGVLENIAPESSKYSWSYKNRVFLALSDGQTVQYSKTREQNGPVEFNDALKVVLDPFGGNLVCGAVLDDHNIYFKERAMFAQSGEGPNNLGQQDDFRVPQLITSDVGCSDANSVVAMPFGLMFKSEKGIYLLDRSLKATYIGDKVEKYNDLTITSATLLSDTNQVRFTTESDIALVYDYYARKWSVFTNIRGIDSLIYEGRYTVARANGQVMSETTAFSDMGTYISTRIVSAWIQLNNIQGYQRIYKLFLLGEYKSNHKLRVGFAYDYNPNVQYDMDILTSDTITPSAYGEGLYGDGPYGGDYPSYQWEASPKVQKCQAFQFVIEDFYVDNIGEAYSISNFAARIGVKVGANKIPTNKVYGAS